MATRRERLENKAERLRGWADGRDEKSAEAYAASRAETSQIPLGQPILVGHHSQRRHEGAIKRADAAMGRSVEHARKAGDMRSRADNIEAANARAIYDDDPDAVDRLRTKLEALEAQRDLIKAYNRTCKAGQETGDLDLLTDALRNDLLSSIRAVPYQCKNGRFPSYKLTNLGGTIRNTRQRIEKLSRPETGRTLVARYDGTCADCSTDLPKGTTVRYFKRERVVRCAPSCETSE